MLPMKRLVRFWGFPSASLTRDYIFDRPNGYEKDVAHKAKISRSLHPSSFIAMYMMQTNAIPAAIPIGVLCAPAAPTTMAIAASTKHPPPLDFAFWGGGCGKKRPVPPQDVH
jgi:hypothetical protein